MDFVHLHLHTDYSILDGACRIPVLVKKLKEFGMRGAAITDHGNMFGAIQFYQELTANNLKPIIGMEAYLVPDRHRKGERKVRNVSGDDVRVSGYHLVLLAMNERGYKNLMALTTKAYLEGFYYKPKVDYELLEEHREGLIALTGCLAGEIPYLIIKGDLQAVENRLKWYLDVYGKDNLYLELQYHGLPEQVKVNRYLIELAKRYGLKLVITNDVHYISRDDAFAHEVLLAIQTGSKLSDPKRFKFRTQEYYLKTYDEMLRTFGDDLKFALHNTVEILERSELKLELNQRHYLPKYPDLPPNLSSAEYLRKLCYENLPKYYDPSDPEVLQRLESELKVIEDMGFPDYFLIVWDFINWARSKGIPVGPGRGSVGGSLVAYLLGITRIDPLRYGLIFERFLNPGRKSLPDIDTDFCFERRDEVIDYVRKRYGEDKVAHIGTFGTMKSRAAIRDVCRVLGYSYSLADSLAKRIPQNSSLEEALENDEELRRAFETDEKIRKALQIAMKLEGIVRNTSVHAAGVVISTEPLVEFTPLHKAQETIATQYEMNSLEAIGLLKMDFLGLRTLTVIHDALRAIKETYGVEISWDNLPLDDPKTYKLLSEGRTVGVFQLESKGMRRILVRLKPNSIDDLIALIALYRPGPLQSGLVDVYIKNKANPENIEYLHPDLEPILKETYGIILYQEQVMRIASKFAGFTLAEADDLRKAMGKKKVELMLKYREKFIEGSVANGYPRELAEKLYDIIEKFAGYGFNKSHSTAYAYISYMTAYLKANYPKEYMASLLTSVRNNPDKLKVFLKECRDMGITVLPPDINRSGVYFKVEGNSIRFGLAGIKNVGESVAEQIVANRRTEFRSFEEFIENMPKSVTNKRVLESLILAGAFDSIEPNRKALLKRLERGVKRDRKLSLSLFQTKGGTNPSGNDNLSTEGSQNLPESGIDRDELLKLEREYLGIYLSGHPIDSVRPEFREATVSIDNLADLNNGDRLMVIGVLTSVSYSKSGKRVVLTLEDDTGELEVLAFTDRIKMDVLELGKLVAVEGKLLISDDEEFKLSFKADALYELKDISVDKLWRVNSKYLREIRRVRDYHSHGDLNGYVTDGTLWIVIPSITSDELLVELKQKLKEISINGNTNLKGSGGRGRRFGVKLVIVDVEGYEVREEREFDLKLQLDPDGVRELVNYVNLPIRTVLEFVGSFNRL